MFPISGWSIWEFVQNSLLFQMKLFMGRWTNVLANLLLVYGHLNAVKMWYSNLHQKPSNRFLNSLNAVSNDSSSHSALKYILVLKILRWADLSFYVSSSFIDNFSKCVALRFTLWRDCFSKITILVTLSNHEWIWTPRSPKSFDQTSNTRLFL